MTIYIKLRQPQTLNLLWRVGVIVSDYTIFQGFILGIQVLENA
jgi:hypothetical protein